MVQRRSSPRRRATAKTPETPQAQALALLQARPKPDLSGHEPTADEFAAWCEHPVTRFVAKAYEAAAEKQREEWIKVSWGGGKMDPLLHTELRTRADAYMAFLETGIDDYRGLVQRT